MTQVDLNVLSGTGFPKTGEVELWDLNQYCSSLWWFQENILFWQWQMCKFLAHFVGHYDALFLLLVIILSVSFYLPTQLLCSHSDRHTWSKSFYNVWCKQTRSTGFCFGSMCAQDWLLFPRQRLFYVCMSQWTIIRIMVSFFILNPLLNSLDQGGHFGSVAKNPIAKKNCLILS